MKKTRRDFIKQTGMAAAAIAATGALTPARSFGGLLRSNEVEMPTDDTVRALMMTAINTAKSAGASYSDVRIGRYHNSIVFTREQQIVNTADVDTIGAGVRALVDGTWGFGATKTLTTDGVAAAARRSSREEACVFADTDCRAIETRVDGGGGRTAVQMGVKLTDCHGPDRSRY